MIRRLAITFFGLGYMPFASGTWGSLGAILVAGGLYAAMRRAGVSEDYDVLLGVLILVACVLSILWGRWAIDYFASRSRKPGDPGQFVLDEVAGQWLSVIALPIAGLPFHTWAAVYAMQFFLFRVFDVLKPPPGRQLERLPSGWGILMDDLGVAVYANIIGQIVVRRWLLS